MTEKKEVQTVTEIQQEKIDYEAIAKSVLRVGQSAARMKSAGLGRRAVCLLIKDLTGVGMEDINRVLNASESLPQKYLTAKFIKKHSGGVAR